MSLKELSLSNLQELRYAIDDIVGYETDNSCGDPDCCGGPYYEKEDFDRGVRRLAGYGLKYVPSE